MRYELSDRRHSMSLLLNSNKKPRMQWYAAMTLRDCGFPIKHTVKCHLYMPEVPPKNNVIISVFLYFLAYFCTDVNDTRRCISNLYHFLIKRSVDILTEECLLLAGAISGYPISPSPKGVSSLRISLKQLYHGMTDLKGDRCRPTSLFCYQTN